MSKEFGAKCTGPMVSLIAACIRLPAWMHCEMETEGIPPFKSQAVREPMSQSLLKVRSAIESRTGRFLANVLHLSSSWIGMNFCNLANTLF